MTRSAAEILLAEQLTQAGIPFEAEYRFAPPRRWRADFCIEGPVWLYRCQFLVECEGGAYVQGRHTRGVGFEKDLEKYNAAAELGYVVLRYSPRQINDGSALEQIRRILSMKGDENRAA